jgi:hypothetical protein
MQVRRNGYLVIFVKGFSTALQSQAGIFELLSAHPEGNVFESVDTRWYALHAYKLRVLADAAVAVVRELVSGETAVDDAFTITTCNVCDAGERRTVLADTRVGRQRNSAATTFFLAARGNKQRRCSQLVRKQTRRAWLWLDRHVQLSRS